MSVDEIDPVAHVVHQVAIERDVVIHPALLTRSYPRYRRDRARAAGLIGYVPANTTPAGQRDRGPHPDPGVAVRDHRCVDHSAARSVRPRSGEGRLNADLPARGPSGPLQEGVRRVAMW
jgi:hypothetical protein